MLPWQPNNMATSHKTYKLGTQSSDDHNCQIWLISLHWLWRKCNFNHFSNISLWEFSVAMATKPRGRPRNFCLFWIFNGNQTKWPLVIKHTNWVDNHLMIITAKYGSHHFICYGENAIKSFSHYKSMGAFSCHGNQTKRQITTILPIFNCPYPSNICTKLESYCFSGLKNFFFKI